MLHKRLLHKTRYDYPEKYGFSYSESNVLPLVKLEIIWITAKVNKLVAPTEFDITLMYIQS